MKLTDVSQFLISSGAELNRQSGGMTGNFFGRYRKYEKVPFKIIDYISTYRIFKFGLILK